MADQRNITQFILTVLLFTGVITAVFTLILQANPDIDMSHYLGSEQFNDTFTTVENIKDETTLNKISQFIELGTDAINGLLSLSTSIIQQVFNSMTALRTAIQVLSVNLGLPYWFTNLIIGVFLISTSFAVIAIWRRYHP